MKAVIYGAGSIGRGFIAQLLHESGYVVVFIDIDPDVIHRLNTYREYVIEIVGIIEMKKF